MAASFSLLNQSDWLDRLLCGQNRKNEKIVKPNWFTYRTACYLHYKPNQHMLRYSETIQDFIKDEQFRSV